MSPATSDSARYAGATRVLGAGLFEKVQHARVLMVGAGGIGCELLKNLATAGFGHIHIIDLDTIDLSNLNRQFLFQKQHIKRSKALVAKETAQKFNPKVEMTATHGNIKEPQFDVNWFASFDLVLNALDNMDARRHVNKMCMASGTPLVESGTAGYSGQVQPIIKDTTECYDCSGKPTPKGFAVCTIRSTPSSPIHCIVWAKSYLFPQLFGSPEESSGEDLDKAAAEGEDVNELAELRKEQEAIKAVRDTLTEPGAEERVFDKVFKRDVERLLSMEDMWKHRKPPVPLSFAELEQSMPSTSTASTSLMKGIKDQRELSLQDSFKLFKDSLGRMIQRVKSGEQDLEWDKDDDDALDFATATANIRAHIFGIPSKTRFDVKQMAGNIIPAIATTNAIVAGLIVLQCLKVLQKQMEDLRLVYVSRRSDKALSATKPPVPEPRCAICRTPYVKLAIHPKTLTMQTFVDEVVKKQVGYPGEVTVRDGRRIIFDPDADESGEKTFEELNISLSTMLEVDDEDTELISSVFVFSELQNGEQPWKLVGDTSKLFDKPAPLPEKEEEPENSVLAGGKKRKADEAELDDKDKDKAKKYKQEGDTIVLEDSDDDEPGGNAAVIHIDSD